IPQPWKSAIATKTAITTRARSLIDGCTFVFSAVVVAVGGVGCGFGFGGCLHWCLLFGCSDFRTVVRVEPAALLSVGLVGAGAAVGAEVVCARDQKKLSCSGTPFASRRSGVARWLSFASCASSCSPSRAANGFWPLVRLQAWQKIAMFRACWRA